MLEFYSRIMIDDKARTKADADVRIDGFPWAEVEIRDGENRSIMLIAIINGICVMSVAMKLKSLVVNFCAYFPMAAEIVSPFEIGIDLIRYIQGIFHKYKEKRSIATPDFELVLCRKP